MRRDETYIGEVVEDVLDTPQLEPRKPLISDKDARNALPGDFIEAGIAEERTQEGQAWGRELAEMVFVKEKRDAIEAKLNQLVAQERGFFKSLTLPLERTRSQVLFNSVDSIAYQPRTLVENRKEDVELWKFGHARRFVRDGMLSNKDGNHLPQNALERSYYSRGFLGAWEEVQKSAIDKQSEQKNEKPWFIPEPSPTRVTSFS